MPIDPDLRRTVLSSLLLGFVGPTPPRWLLDALADGLGGVVLFGSNLGDGTGVRGLTDQLRAAAGRDVVISLDEEGGDVTRLDTVRGSETPGSAALGHLDDVDITQAAYARIGARLAEAGVTADLAPVADVNVDPLNPVIGLRSFSPDATVAARHVAAAVRGLQGVGVAAVVKHFPGHGATRNDSHHEVAVLDRTRAEIEAVELEPFRAAIAAGTRSVMTGHLLVPALDDQLATVSPAITTDLLRRELGFTGTIYTDALEMRAVSGTIGMVEGFVRALIAGADAIETGAMDYPELLEQIPLAVTAALDAGRLSLDRLTDAAARTRDLAVMGSAVMGSAVSGVSGAVLARAAAHSLEVLGELPELRAPLVIECATPPGMASGELPWSLGAPLAEVLPGTETLRLHETPDMARIGRAADGRGLVVLIRDADRVGWQRPLIDLAARHPAAVLVDAGWPSDPIALRNGTNLPIIRTRGIAPGLLRATAELLAAAPARTLDSKEVRV